MTTFKKAKNNTFVNIVLPIIILVLGLLFAVLPWSDPKKLDFFWDDISRLFLIHKMYE